MTLPQRNVKQVTQILWAVVSLSVKYEEGGARRQHSDLISSLLALVQRGEMQLLRMASLGGPKELWPSIINHWPIVASLILAYCCLRMPAFRSALS